MFASGLARSIPPEAGIVAMEVDMGITDLPRPVGYVLGGGGSLGAVQVGMLQALSEHDIAPGVVAGTSVGSLAVRLEHVTHDLADGVRAGDVDDARTLVLAGASAYIHGYGTAYRPRGYPPGRTARRVVAGG
jgi:hypothetical protein